MTDTPTPTLTELLAQQATLSQQLAQLQVTELTAANATFSDPSFAALRTALQGHMDALPDGVGKQQLGFAITVLTNVPVAVANELEAQTAAANPPLVVAPVVVPPTPPQP